MPHPLTPLLAELGRAASRPRIAVVGDIVMDYYYPVDVRRISPEFPIPVLQTPDEACTVRPGGAANVVEQLRHFPADARLYTFLDPASIDHLSPGFRQAAIGSVAGPECSVPKKKRYYDRDHDHQLCRVDVEKPEYGLGGKILEWRKQLLKQLTPAVRDRHVDVVVCSDYSKGVFDDHTAQQIVALCRNAGVPLIVDPKADPQRWRGCTVFKPNLAEARKFVPDETKPRLLAERLYADLDCDAVVITMGGGGVCGHWDGVEFYHAPTGKAVPRSVIGAGDCFAAVFALSLALGLDFEQAARAAYEAGAIYVRNVHNEPVHPHDLALAADPVGGKIVTPDRLRYIMSTWPAPQYVFTNGCYDLLHAGHLATLTCAKAQGDKVIVALNSDESVRRLKGDGRPLVPLADRLRMVAALSVVDYVVSFDEDTPRELIAHLRPHVLVKGGDYRAEDVVGADLVDRVIIAPTLPGRSTSRLAVALEV